MLSPKALWKLSQRAGEPPGNWVSSSRDTLENWRRFREWLESIPWATDDRCQLITGPHEARELSWTETIQSLMDLPVDLETLPHDIVVLHSSLKAKLILKRQGVAALSLSL